MKRQPLLDLIEHMKKIDDDHFNMKAWIFRVGDSAFKGIRFDGEESIPHCKTGGCLAGEVFLMLTPEKRAEYKKKHESGYCGVVEAAAIKELGLNYDEARALFQPTVGEAMVDWTRQQAIQVLEHIRDHQVIDWGRVLSIPHSLPHLTPIKVELTD